MRTFIAIDIPEEIKREIVKIQQQIPEFNGKLTEYENLHLTLKFLGEVDEKRVEEVRRKLREVNYSAFESEIGEIGIFDNRNSRSYSQQIIVWLYLSKCEGLQKAADEALTGFFPREKRFMSHLTLARVKGIKNEKKFFDYVRKLEIPPLKFKVIHFELKESILRAEGPEYKTVEDYKLN
jgi:2'-5' RNA ligase